MTTIRYARFVLVNEDKGFIAWYDKKATAYKIQASVGGTVFDYDTDNHQTVEHAILSARHRMGVE